MKDKTKWAKGLPDDELAAIVRRWPVTIADLQSGLSAANFELRRRNRKAKEEGERGLSRRVFGEALRGRA